jgi:hypothetical protein
MIKTKKYINIMIPEMSFIIYLNSITLAEIKLKLI